ncbi:MAG: peptidylprolyl isomerase [Fidelibacterota bacterium]
MKKFVFFILTCLLNFNMYFGQQALDGIAAIVGEKIILKSEVAQIVQMSALNNGLDPQGDSPQLVELTQNVLQSLIDQKIVLSIAEAESVVVSKQEVDAALDLHVASVVSRVGSEEKIEDIFGKSLRELKRQLWPEIRDQLIVERFQSQMLSDIVISRKEVEKFFSEYKDSLGVLPELYDLQWLHLTITPGWTTKQKTIEKLKNLRSRILGGEDFASLAKQFSQDPGSAKNGGELGFTARGTLVPEYEEIAINLSDGEISDVVETPFGYHIIQTIGRMGEKINTRHILLIPQPSEADEDSVYTLAKSLADSIHNTKDLAVYATQYSDDKSSKKLGGRLGYRDISSLPYPGLEHLLPSLPLKEVSDPVWVETAYVILAVIDVRPGGVPTLEDHWTQIESYALEKKKSDIFVNWLSKASSTVFTKTFE